MFTSFQIGMYLGVLSIGGSAISRFGGIAATLERGGLEVIWILIDGVEFRASHPVDGSHIDRIVPRFLLPGKGFLSREDVNQTGEICVD